MYRPGLLTARPRADWLEEIREPRVHRPLDVISSEPIWHNTGLLGPTGDPIMRCVYPGPQPVGFLWDAERGVSRERRSLDNLPEDATEPGC
jgi:hypothetical protein